MTPEGWQTVALALIAAVVSLGAPVIAFMLASVANSQKKVSAEVADVHHIVNNSQTEMVKRLAEMNERLLALAATNAALVETARGKELQAARAEHPAPAPATGMTSTTQVVVPVPVEIVSTATTVPVEIVEDEPPDRRPGRRPRPENDPSSHL